MQIKPGWIVLALVALYALFATVALNQNRRQVTALRQEIEKLEAKLAQGPEGFSFPIPGACLPKNQNNWPGAPREYRKGLNPGFVFVDGDSCVPIVYGMGVLAAGSGEVIKAESVYKENTPAEFAELIKAVANGASPAQMDRLRGREVWIRHAEGFVSVYAHLSEIAPGIRVGVRVRKGEFIGKVGNSGTQAAAQKSRAGARLLFELWDGEPDKDRFFGQDMRREALPAQAKLRFGLE
ncbi:M23 family metallopeptidase [Calidithermus timidus]|jgi:murein DD-endopeptidase MepM/ murein hydrolase activator NlpD|uniref:M23 family metallopeptidase n=1 Tax=Calidithermus timidus TaxID=307124 RepID=UPI0003721EAB|nr:M23 family metallopeptidase [Calidithermus timidus]